MALSEKKEKALSRMPYIETRIEKSKDGKFVINKTTITHVRPIAYYKAVIESEPEDFAEQEQVEVEKLEA